MWLTFLYICYLKYLYNNYIQQNGNKVDQTDFWWKKGGKKRWILDYRLTMYVSLSSCFECIIDVYQDKWMLLNSNGLIVVSIDLDQCTACHVVNMHILIWKYLFLLVTLTFHNVNPQVLHSYWLDKRLTFLSAVIPLWSSFRANKSFAFY